MNNYNFDEYRQAGFTTISNLLIENYAQLGISETQFILLLQLESNIQKGNYLPDNNLLASRTNFSTADVGIGLQTLIDQKLIDIVEIKDSDNRILNKYSLSPLYKKLTEFLDKNRPLSQASEDISANSLADSSNDNPISTLIRQFEVEFGRLLGPMEREMVQNWLTIDHYDPEVVQLALRESVLSQVYNFKYIDRILLNWQRMNLKTGNQVKHYLHQ